MSAQGVLRLTKVEGLQYGRLWMFWLWEQCQMSLQLKYLYDMVSIANSMQLILQGPPGPRQECVMAGVYIRICVAMSA